jgi:hypothetical protein
LPESTLDQVHGIERCGGGLWCRQMAGNVDDTIATWVVKHGSFLLVDL